MSHARLLSAALLSVAAVLGAAAVPASAGGVSSLATVGDEPAVSLTSTLASPAGDWTSGPRANGTGVLPDGRFVTPAGRSVQVDEEPQNAVLSHDGRRLYVSSEGWDDAPLTGDSERYLDVVDTATMTVVQRVRDDEMHSGIAESPDGLTVYVDEGQTDTLGVFRRTPSSDGGVGTLAKVADWKLYAASAKPDDYPWGLTLSPDGSKAYVTGFSGDSLIVVDTATGAVLSRVATGAYPYGVVVSPDGTRAYVSNWGLYNADAALGYSSPIAPPPATYGGYNTTNSDSVWTYDLTGATPKVVAATRIGQDLNGADVDGGSSPSGLALSPDGKTLAVTSSNDDEVELLDVTQTTTSLAVPSANAPAVPAHPAAEVDMRVLDGTAAVPGPTGAQPDAVTWSPDGKVLFVAEGERNDVAVVDPSKVVSDEGTLTPVNGVLGDGVGTAAGPNRDAIVGRIPTAWYPSAVTTSSDGSHLYIASLKGLASGPSDTPATASNKGDVFGRVQDVELSAACASLPQLSADSDRDNGLVPAGTGSTGDASTADGNGYVVPTAYGQGPSSKVKHVFLIIKENRTFDQVLGDLPGAETDGSLVEYGKTVTPNTHALAGQFSVSDNYDVTAETSTQGHYTVDTGQDDEFLEKVTPSNYSGKFPYGAWDTTPENLPEGGFIWNNAARHGVRTTVFGEATAVVGLAPTLLGKSPTQTPAGQLVPGVQNSAYTTFDPLYPSQVDIAGAFNPVGVNETVYPFNDEGRASAFDDDLAAAEQAAQSTQDETTGPVASTASIGALNVMILFDDHTSGYLPGATSPEDNIAENDHALGRVVDTITHSSYWKDSAIFVTEDDTQGGQDHVDAYRSYGLVISPWAKRGYVSHVHTSFASMTKTIDLLLGLPPTSLQELTATSMADMFISSGDPDDSPYSVLPDTVYKEINPTPADAPNAKSREAAEVAERMPKRIDAAGLMLPADLELGREGAMEAGDPNVVPAKATSFHTLTADGSPTPVTLGAPVATGGTPAADTCLTAGSVGPLLPESHGSTLLVAGAGAAVVAWFVVVRRRRRTSLG